MNLPLADKSIVLGPPSMQGDLAMPDDAWALILFVHPDTASQREPGLRFIADVLQANRLGTLSFSLCAEGEPLPGLDAASARIRSVLDWVAGRPTLAGHPVALFGMAGAVPGCIAAAARPGSATVHSLMLLDGRPDQAGADLAQLRQPTLFLVGGSNPQALASHCAAAKAIRARHRLDVLAQPTQPRATNGAHEAIARSAMSWLAQSMPLLGTPTQAETGASTAPGPGAQDDGAVARQPPRPARPHEARRLAAGLRPALAL